MCSQIILCKHADDMRHRAVGREAACNIALPSSASSTPLSPPNVANSSHDDIRVRFYLRAHRKPSTLGRLGREIVAEAASSVSNSGVSSSETSNWTACQFRPHELDRLPVHTVWTVLHAL